MPSTADPLPNAALDTLLTLQIAVAWAGESGDEPRLGWWRTELVSEFGGQDLFEYLLPKTWRWALLQSAREAARRHDERGRQASHDPDQLITLYRLGFTTDERLEQRLLDLKGSGQRPTQALPGLAEVLTETWRPHDFAEWVAAHPAHPTQPAPAGRRLTGSVPLAIDHLARQLVRALAPLGETYPLPHYRVTR